MKSFLAKKFHTPLAKPVFSNQIKHKFLHFRGHYRNRLQRLHYFFPNLRIGYLTLFPCGLWLLLFCLQRQVYRVNGSTCKDLIIIIDTHKGFSRSSGKFFSGETTLEEQMVTSEIVMVTVMAVVSSGDYFRIDECCVSLRERYWWWMSSNGITDGDDNGDYSVNDGDDAGDFYWVWSLMHWWW